MPIISTTNITERETYNYSEQYGIEKITNDDFRKWGGIWQTTVQEIFDVVVYGVQTSGT